MKNFSEHSTNHRSMLTRDLNDGAGDPVVGWEEYDFDSIMHYAPTYNYKTVIKPAFGFEGKEFGNARKPSSGDVRQINDMYQCVPKENVCEEFALKATTGGCQLDMQTCCATSPRFYKPGDSCKIFLGDSPGTVSIPSDHFNLQAGDKLTLKGQEYAGRNGPEGVSAPRGVIEWTAASENGAGKGFQMCFPKTCNPNGQCDKKIGVATCSFPFASLCGGAFVQDTEDDLDWLRHRLETSTRSTGPKQGADADGYYMYVEATGAKQGQ